MEWAFRQRIEFQERSIVRMTYSAVTPFKNA